MNALFTPFIVYRRVFRKRLPLFLLLVLTSFWLPATLLPAWGQSIDTWTAHTSMNRANDMAVDGSEVWVATGGGVFGYDTETGAVRSFTVVDGLSGVSTTSIAIDSKRSSIWVGFSDGSLNRIRTESGTIQTFRDIRRADQFSERGINRIVVHGDSLFIATQFGVVVFDPERQEVRDSFSRLGNLVPATPVRDVFIENAVLGRPTVWLATETGVARAFLDGPNLQDPFSWTIEKNGLNATSLSTYSLEALGGSIYVGTEQDLYSRTPNGTFTKFNITGQKVTQLSVSGNVLVGSAEFRVLVVEAGIGWRTLGVSGVLFPSSVFLSDVGTLWVGSADSGIAFGDLPTGGDTFIPSGTRTPSGPSTGDFTNLAVGVEGDLWVGGASANNTGFHHLKEDGDWVEYSEKTSPLLVNKSRFLHVFGAKDGIGWAGSEGGGVARVSLSGELDLFDTSNSSLLPATGTSSFIVVGGAHEDRFGNMWFTTRGSGAPLHVRQASGEWSAFGPMIGEGLLSRSTAYGEIFIDSFDQKWILIHNENNFVAKRGLAVLDTGALSNPGDDSFRFFGAKGGAGVGLPGTEVNAVAEDRDGLVWIGTNSGPAFFINTGIVARDKSAQPIWPQWADRSQGTFMLFGLNINDVAVDPAGRIWFATSEGAWLVESTEGGYRPVKHFTTDNSPIFSDEVNSVAVNGETGRVYFSTDRGLVSYLSDAINPSESVRELKVFPNPVRMSSNSSPEVFVEGLVAETSVRIVTSSGSLVRRIEARGGRLSWDGRDENGQLVSSGVYLVIAVGQNDEGTAYGKIAVIR